jgi:hypothetical protein
VLDRTMQTVQRGREQLQAVVGPPPPSEPPAEMLSDLEETGVFDQDDL